MPERPTTATHGERESSAPSAPPSLPVGCLLTADDLQRFHDGTHFRLYEKLGAHVTTVDGAHGVSFNVWAPNARRVSVIGDFNRWNPASLDLEPVGESGIWSGFAEGVKPGALYKYHIESRFHGYAVDKADPFGSRCETPPSTASVVWGLDYRWDDADWMARRGEHNALDAPMAVYEMHLGSWKRAEDDPQRMLTYREIAAELIPYLGKMGFTHVEFLPPKEHPYYGSWGYQTTGYFAPTTRYGSPQDLMYLIDELHRNGVGVILDWVGSHFPTDEHGIGFFDGTHLFEHADPRMGYHQDWQSLIFNYGRNEVRSFLISGALFWLDRYHVDGLRVDSVASMLYRDYSRKEGEWIPNEYGGRENLEAIGFLRQLNDLAHEHYPDARTIAEESTAWPMVSRPSYLGGLGFDMKWDMGWMHDTLAYMAQDPIHRKYHHGTLTFRMLYAFTENFMLPLSHDEVVHGKRSLVDKMPGDLWQKFANLRAMLGYMYAQPGKKLLFMGAELGQWREWDHERGLDWELLKNAPHAGLQRWVQDLNGLYRREKALHASDFSPEGFRWVDCHDADNSVVSLTRHHGPEQTLLAICNLTPVVRRNYRVGVPHEGRWAELLNSDAREYGGSGVGNSGGSEALAIRYHGLPFSLNLTLPPLSASFFKWEGSPSPATEPADDSTSSEN